MKPVLGLFAVLLLAACDPQAMADKTARSMAREVIVPVVSRDLPAGPAGQAADCILSAAEITEVRALARDYGVTAGTLTRDSIRNLALRPAAQSCFAANGLPPVR